MRSSCARPRIDPRSRRAARLACAALACALVAAEPGDDAARTLDALQKRYDAIKDVRAGFAQTSWSAALGTASEARGTVVVKRPGQMRWEYAAPDGRVILLDKNSIRIWNPDDKQLQIAALTPGNVSPTALGFLLGQAVLRDTFDATPLHEPGRPEVGLALEPKTDGGFEKLELWLDPKTHQLLESVVVDLFGNKTRVRFDSIAENAGVDKNAFELALPPDAEVVDLR